MNGPIVLVMMEALGYLNKKQLIFVNEKKRHGWYFIPYFKCLVKKMFVLWEKEL